MFPADRKPQPVAVTYNGKRGRCCRHFADMFAARRFFTQADRQGLHPHVQRSDTMPTVKKNAAAAATTDTAAAAPKEKKAKATKATKATKAQPKARAKATEAQPAAATAPNGLTGNEAKVLAVLAKQPTGKTLGRAAMVEATGIKGGWSRMLGAATKEDGGVRGDTSLQARGLIKCTQVEGTRELQYAITAAGKAALKKGSK